MASLVLGAAGAFIGSFFGPLGTSIGWAVGSAIGNSIGQKGTEGPRLTDLKLQTSAYGSTIPIVYGRARTAGASVIWQTDLHEHEHTSGGKGGNSQESKTYTYTASFAIMLCEGPIIGLEKIWADNRLVWDGGSSTGSATDLPFTLYLGTATQLPDPTIESYEGVGNVPAHRRYAYIVFNELDLQPFFNRIPQFTFLIHATGDPVLEEYAKWDVDNPLGDGFAYAYPLTLAGQELDAKGEVLTQHEWRSANDYGGTNGDLSYNFRNTSLQGSVISSASTSSSYPSLSAPLAIFMSQNSIHVHAGYQFNTQCVVDGPVISLNQSFWLPLSPDVIPPPPCAFTATNGYRLGVGDNGGCAFYYRGYLYASGGGFVDTPEFGGPGIWIERWPCNELQEVSAFYADRQFMLRDTVAGNTPYGHVDAGGISLTVGDDGFVYVIFSVSDEAKNIMVKLNRDLELLQTWDPLPFPYSVGNGSFTVFQNYILVAANASPTFLNPGFFLYKIEDDLTFTETAHLYGGFTPPSPFPTPIISLGHGFAAWRGGILNLGGDTTLAAIVTDISERMGLTVGDIDVTDLPDIVHGYVIGQQMTGRAAIEGLMPAFNFDGVESDLKVKFVKRNHDPAATIELADLGATANADEHPPPLPVIRTQEFELPRRIYVKYFNKDADYQDGTQIGTRSVTNSELDVTVNIAVCMSDQEAKFAADRLLQNAWAERNKFKPFSTSMKFAYLEPTDVVYVSGYPVRVTSKVEEGGVIHWEGALSVATVRLQGAPPQSPIFVPQPIPVAQATSLLMLDIPLILDGDAPYGNYVAMNGAQRRDWVGAQLNKSVDGGTNYSVLLSSATPDTFGIALSVLGSFDGGEVFDETNSVDIALNAGSGELASVSSLAVLNGVNWFLIGDEIVGAKNCVLTDTKRYTLTGLLRGRRGTDWAIGTHVLSERVVSLPTQLNVAALFEELDVDRLYKPVTIGDTLANTTATTFANSGIAIQPYTPVLLGGGRNAAGDIALTWVRRTRIGGAWKDFIDAPLSEPTEHYQISFYTDSTYGTFVFGVGSTTQSYTLTAADQVSEMGGLQNPLYFTVLQDGQYLPGREARGSA